MIASKFKTARTLSVACLFLLCSAAYAQVHVGNGMDSGFAFDSDGGLFVVDETGGGHDGNVSAKTVKIYQASASSSDLSLVFDGDYSGSYAVSVGDIRLAHSHDSGDPSYMDSEFQQLLVYDRVLSASEAEQNHDAGTDSLVGVGNPPDPPNPLTAGNSSLTVGASGHYFDYSGEDRMIIADSGTQGVMQNAAVDYRAWVDQMEDEGFKDLHIWSFIPPRYQLDGSELESRWGYAYPGLTPWPRKSSGPSAHDGGNQWDLFDFDEGTNPDQQYWPRLRDLCSRLTAKDMSLGITVFFGWPKDGSDLNYHPFYHLNGGPANSRADITSIDSPGTEVHGQNYNSGWPARKKTQWFWEKFALKLIETADACGNVWFDFRDEWSYDNDTNMETHFRNFFMSRGQIWSDRTSSASFRVENPDVPNFGSTPAMMTEGGPTDDEGILGEVWNRAIDGVHYLLHDDPSSRTAGIMAWDPTTAALQGRDPYYDPGRVYAGHAARFFNESIQNLNGMLPDDGIASPGEALHVDGEEYVVYLNNGGTTTVDLGGVSGAFDVRWFNPRTGATTTAGTVAAGGPVALTPASGSPWVAHLVRYGGAGPVRPDAPTNLSVD